MLECAYGGLFGEEVPKLRRVGDLYMRLGLAQLYNGWLEKLVENEVIII